MPSAVELGSLNHWTARAVPYIWSFYHMSDKPLSDFMYVILLMLSVSPSSNEEPKGAYLEILKNTVRRNSA